MKTWIRSSVLCVLLLGQIKVLRAGSTAPIVQEHGTSVTGLSARTVASLPHGENSRVDGRAGSKDPVAMAEAVLSQGALMSSASSVTDSYAFQHKAPNSSKKKTRRNMLLDIPAILAISISGAIWLGYLLFGRREKLLARRRIQTILSSGRSANMPVWRGEDIVPWVRGQVKQEKSSERALEKMVGTSMSDGRL